MPVRPARLEDLPAVWRLAAALVRLHHRLDPPRFLLVELDAMTPPTKPG